MYSEIVSPWNTACSSLHKLEQTGIIIGGLNDDFTRLTSPPEKKTSVIVLVTGGDSLNRRLYDLGEVLASVSIRLDS